MTYFHSGISLLWTSMHEGWYWAIGIFVWWSLMWLDTFIRIGFETKYELILLPLFGIREAVATRSFGYFFVSSAYFILWPLCLLAILCANAFGYLLGMALLGNSCNCTRR